jgi:hypothetical protein
MIGLPSGTRIWLAAGTDAALLRLVLQSLRA